MARVPYIGKKDLSDEQQELIESHTVRPGESLHVRQTLANNPPLLEAHHEYGSTVRGKNGLSIRQRELVILTVAYELRSIYIWQQHVTFACDRTLSKTEIEQVIEGEYSAFDDDVAALLNYASAFATMSVTDDSHNELSAHYSDEDIVGIGVLVMNYVGLAHGTAGFGVEIEHDEFVGWNIENSLL